MIFDFFIRFIYNYFNNVCLMKGCNKRINISSNHTVIVQKGLKLGFILFVSSEVVFFGGFFRAFFHSSLSPSIVLGMI